ncbi:hypothetical protein D7147_08180 [Micromonospora musae]|uniref:Immunity protein 35 domain-containing protein n=2 Tax=Micromonospora musae TaxID=1894970 RepID=A0ABX9RB43_9ACTN|nr:hypothetical protein D7147_08180 [Micromonospora musae]
MPTRRPRICWIGWCVRGAAAMSSFALVGSSPTAWVFGCNTRRFLQDMELLASLVGNGPVVVPKSGEPPYLGVSGGPIEDQIQP